MNWYSVKVDWLPLDKGGRKTLPNGKQYITISRFKEESDDKWFTNTWSIVLAFDNPPDSQGYTCFGKARFLVDNAPSDKLREGCNFDLYEGFKKVAEVTVLKPLYFSESKVLNLSEVKST